MTDIELFFKIAESEIRRKHINYLKSEKCLPDSNPPEEIITAQELKNLGKFKFCGMPLFGLRWFIGRFRYIKRLRLIKRYNKGIDTALNVLQREYKRFDKRLKKGENE